MFENLPTLKETVDQYYLQTQEKLAKKKLGQNFLLNMDVVRRVARVAGDLSHVTVLEIGPGPGGLTRALLEAGAQRVIAVEKDPRCIELLSELNEAAGNRLEIINDDALKIVPQDLAEGPLKIVANLPYNVGTILLINWLHYMKNIESMTLMFQKEVALRIVSKPRTKDYGRLSVLCQYLCTVHKAFDLPPGAFSPPPKVTSSVVHLIPKQLSEKQLELLPFLEAVTQKAFGQRRKMLRSSLKGIFSEEDFLNVSVLPTARAEELSLQDFINLSQLLINFKNISS